MSGNHNCRKKSSFIILSPALSLPTGQAGKREGAGTAAGANH